MKAEARDLRDLARDLEETCRRSQAHSMAWEPVLALSGYLQLRARLIELEELNLPVLPPPVTVHADRAEV